VTTTPMTPLLERNEQFARTFTPVPLGIPAAHVIVVTCLDHRVAPEITLGLKLGDAAVIRNAGGRVTQPIIEEIAYLAFLGKRISGGLLPDDLRVEVAVIHHTQCGTGLLADPGYRREASEVTGMDEWRWKPQPSTTRTSPSRPTLNDCSPRHYSHREWASPDTCTTSRPDASPPSSTIGEPGECAGNDHEPLPPRRAGTSGPGYFAVPPP
jgi:carbonic anhydrase